MAHIVHHKPAKVIMLSQKEELAKETLEDLKNWGDPSIVQWIQCDFENLKMTDEVAKKVKEKEKRLDVVCILGGANLAKC